MTRAPGHDEESSGPNEKLSPWKTGLCLALGNNEANKHTGAWLTPRSLQALSSLTPSQVWSPKKKYTHLKYFYKKGHWWGLLPTAGQGKGQKELSQTFSPSARDHSFQETQSPSKRVYLPNPVTGLISFWMF